MVVALVGLLIDYGVPLLDLVEALQQRDGDEDDDGLLAMADLDLFWFVRSSIHWRNVSFRDSCPSINPTQFQPRRRDETTQFNQ